MSSVHPTQDSAKLLSSKKVFHNYDRNRAPVSESTEDGSPPRIPRDNKDNKSSSDSSTSSTPLDKDVSSSSHYSRMPALTNRGGGGPLHLSQSGLASVTLKADSGGGGGGPPPLHSSLFFKEDKAAEENDENNKVNSVVQAEADKEELQQIKEALHLAMHSKGAEALEARFLEQVRKNKALTIQLGVERGKAAAAAAAGSSGSGNSSTGVNFRHSFAGQRQASREDKRRSGSFSSQSNWKTKRTNPLCPTITDLAGGLGTINARQQLSSFPHPKTFMAGNVPGYSRGGGRKLSVLDGQQDSQKGNGHQDVPVDPALVRSLKSKLASFQKQQEEQALALKEARKEIQFWRQVVEKETGLNKEGLAKLLSYYHGSAAHKVVNSLMKSDVLPPTVANKGNEEEKAERYEGGKGEGRGKETVDSSLGAGSIFSRKPSNPSQRQSGKDNVEGSLDSEGSPKRKSSSTSRSLGSGLSEEGEKGEKDDHEDFLLGETGVRGSAEKNGGNSAALELHHQKDEKGFTTPPLLRSNGEVSKGTANFSQSKAHERIKTFRHLFSADSGQGIKPNTSAKGWKGRAEVIELLREKIKQMEADLVFEKKREEQLKLVIRRLRAGSFSYPPSDSHVVKNIPTAFEKRSSSITGGGKRGSTSAFPDTLQDPHSLGQRQEETEGDGEDDKFITAVLQEMGMQPVSVVWEDLPRIVAPEKIKGDGEVASGGGGGGGGGDVGSFIPAIKKKNKDTLDASVDYRYLVSRQGLVLKSEKTKVEELKKELDEQHQRYGIAQSRLKILQRDLQRCRKQMDIMVRKSATDDELINSYKTEILEILEELKKTKKKCQELAQRAQVMASLRSSKNGGVMEKGRGGGVETQSPLSISGPHSKSEHAEEQEVVVVEEVKRDSSAENDSEGKHSHLSIQRDSPRNGASPPPHPPHQQDKQDPTSHSYSGQGSLRHSSEDSSYSYSIPDSVRKIELAHATLQKALEDAPMPLTKDEQDLEVEKETMRREEKPRERELTKEKSKERDTLREREREREKSKERERMKEKEKTEIQGKGQAEKRRNGKGTTKKENTVEEIEAKEGRGERISEKKKGKSKEKR